MLGRVIEVETLYKNEQAKVKQLEKELERLAVASHSSTKKNGLRLDPHPILEIEFAELKLGEQISMGGFSVIHKGSYKGLEVAIKKVFNPNITEDLLAEFGTEINMLAKFRHPNIILLVGICSQPPNLCIVMEYMPNGSLYDLLYKQKVELKEKEKSYLTHQIIDTLYYLHSHSIVHRDIKSHNFLVGEQLHLKLCDFGLAKHQVTTIPNNTLSSTLEACNLVGRQSIWPLNSSSRRATIVPSMYLHWVPCCTRCTPAKSPTMGSIPAILRTRCSRIVPFRANLPSKRVFCR